MQKLVHRALLRESEIIRLGSTSGVGATGSEPVVFDSVFHISLQPIAHVRPQYGYVNINHRSDPHIHGACTSDE